MLIFFEISVPGQQTSSFELKKPDTSPICQGTDDKFLSRSRGRGVMGIYPPNATFPPKKWPALLRDY